jgi:tRNA-specific 2-thiouridylase
MQVNPSDKPGLESGTPTGRKVLVGMSGGIDSTMAVHCLLKEGYSVTGLTLKTWNISELEQTRMIEKAQRVAQQMNIPHQVADVEEPFKKEVVDYFCNEYLQGRTPNPCHRCNPVIKWNYLSLKANELGCDYIATGHYVRKVFDNGLWYLHKGVDPVKDQSYFLWNLSQEVMARALFPLGNLTKERVKQMAADLELDQESGRKESMGVCFLSGMDYRRFLRQKHERGEINIVPGEIVDEEGTLLGHHRGVTDFTIGQKRDLNLPDKAFFVKTIDSIGHRLIVSKTAPLEATSIFLSEFHLVAPLKVGKALTVEVKIRGLDRVPAIPGHLTIKDSGLQVELSSPAWALTPGQRRVFYVNDRVIGGGTV